jgi:hypothetical protein
VIHLPCCGKLHRGPDSTQNSRCRIKELRFEMDADSGGASVEVEFEKERADQKLPAPEGRMHLHRTQVVEILHETRKAGLLIDRNERRRIVHRLRVLLRQVRSGVPSNVPMLLEALIDKTRRGK